MGGFLGGPKGMLAPPLKLLGGGLAPPGPPSSYAYVLNNVSPAFIDNERGLWTTWDKRCTNVSRLPVAKKLYKNSIYD